MKLEKYILSNNVNFCLKNLDVNLKMYKEKKKMYKEHKIFENSHMGMWLKSFKIATSDKCRVTKNGLYILVEKFSSGKVNRGWTHLFKTYKFLFVIYIVNNPKRSTSS